MSEAMIAGGIAIGLATIGGICRVIYMLGRANTGRSNPREHTHMRPNDVVSRDFCDERHKNIERILINIEQKINQIPDIAAWITQQKEK